MPDTVRKQKDLFLRPESFSKLGHGLFCLVLGGQAPRPWQRGNCVRTWAFPIQTSGRCVNAEVTNAESLVYKLMAHGQSFQASKLVKIYYSQFATPNELVHLGIAYAWLLTL